PLAVEICPAQDIPTRPVLGGLDPSAHPAKRAYTVVCDRLVVRHGADPRPSLLELSPEIYAQYVGARSTTSQCPAGAESIPQPPNHNDFIVQPRWVVSATHARESLEKLGFSAASTELRNRWIRFSLNGEAALNSPD